MKLDAAKSAGALLGMQLGELICAALTYFAHIPISGAVEADITGVCVFLISHFLPSTGVNP